MTVGQLLRTPPKHLTSREVEVFLQNILAVERSWLYAHPEAELTPAQTEKLARYTQARENNQPVAYIVGYKEFYGRRFQCDKRALIPRPESEGLIDRAQEWLPSYFSQYLKEKGKPCPLRILDIGTGSGNLAITLTLELAQRSIPVHTVATDFSPEALQLAQENWRQLQSETAGKFVQLQFLQANLCDHPGISKQAPYDLVIANLPYVPDQWKFDSQAQPEVVFQEPDLALFAGPDGLQLYRQFFAQVGGLLHSHSRILIEYDGEEQTVALQEVIHHQLPLRKIEIYKDYAGLDRIIEVV